MKKYIGIALAVLMVVGFSGVVAAEQLTANHTFNFDVTVERYIEVGTQTDFTLSPISPPGGGTLPGISDVFNQVEVAYANGPFRVDLAGNNGDNDGLPILAREEVGPNANGWDRLLTRLEFHYIVNGVWNGATFGDHVNWLNVWASGQSGRDYVVMGETPHDGEVNLTLKLGANLPHQSPEWGSDNTWDESADAGPYTCWVQATYTAL